MSVDPWATLDTKPAAETQDELASRFPSVEQFSLLHDSGTKFQFSDGASPLSTQSDFGSLVAERLAEDAFSAISPPSQPRQTVTSEPRPTESISRGVTGTRPVVYEPQPERPAMVSTGTMTSPVQSRSSSPRYEKPPYNLELTLQPSNSSRGQASVAPTSGASRGPQLHQEEQRTQLQDPGRPTIQRSSSRPSLEVTRSSSAIQTQAPSRSRSVNSRPRPQSLYVESNLDFLRDLDSPGSTQGPSTGGIASLHVQETGQSITSQRSVNIESNVDFLRAMETEADSAKMEKRGSSGGLVGKHVKRASMPSISLPSTKGLLAGKFGDAFKRFERNNGNGVGIDTGRAPSPSADSSDVRGVMPTITGSQSTSEPSDEPWQVTSEEVPPEVRRELERRQLSQEEKRVAAAAEEYKKRVAAKPQAEGNDIAERKGSRTRANSIQKRVHALLNENKEVPPKTAEGYGHYTEARRQVQSSTGASPRVAKGDAYRHAQAHGHRTGGPTYPLGSAEPAMARLEPRLERAVEVRSATSRTIPSVLPKRTLPGQLHPVVSAPATAPALARPNPPPKPNKLRGLGGPASARKMEDSTGGLSNDVAIEDDWETSFAKRYPSLSGLEMVEASVVTNSRKL